MKKMVVLMMAMIMMMLCGTALGGYWDEKEIKYLYDEEIQWCKDQGYDEYVNDTVSEDKMLLCCGMITKEDAVFYDAYPDTILNSAYCRRIEEELGVEMHSIEIVHVDTLSGYGLYRLIMKWNTPIKFRTVDEEVYGMDCFVRFYN